MTSQPRSLLDRLQSLVATLLATSPAGHGLCLIGGFRYRLLNASCRVSQDIDYHWDGDLETKQADVVNVLRKRLLPEVKRQFDYDGHVQPATGPGADSPAVRIIELAFFRSAEAGSRIEVPVEITRIPRLDPPLVRTVMGTVFLTVSDADMIESKILALFSRDFVRVRDVLDVFLFHDALPANARERLRQKLSGLALGPAEVRERWAALQVNRVVHERALERLLAEQVDPAVAANLRAAGGAGTIYDTVLRLLIDAFPVPQDSEL
jgi:hypothetical protein